jgi:hypothetical protein
MLTFADGTTGFTVYGLETSGVIRLRPPEGPSRRTPPPVRDNLDHGDIPVALIRGSQSVTLDNTTNKFSKVASISGAGNIVLYDSVALGIDSVTDGTGTVNGVLGSATTKTITVNGASLSQAQPLQGSTVTVKTLDVRPERLSTFRER